MPRGRPIGSIVRQNIVEMLAVMQKGYGYDIARTYNKIFQKVTMRLVYYHLRKGIQTGEIKLDSVEKEKGDYSWGEDVEKKYYSLGEQAVVRGDDRVTEFFRNKANA